MNPRDPDRAPPLRLRPLFVVERDDDRSSHRHRQLIGWLGFFLPLLLWLIAGWRPTEGLPRWGLLESVSSYYYTGAVVAFVGILSALAVFLFTYEGYDNALRSRDRGAAIVAGIAALGVAFFPTDAPVLALRPSWWTPLMRTLHYGSAVVLFGSFIVFALFLFPKSAGKPGEPADRGKKVRNALYVVCGVFMLACMVWAGIAGANESPIFLPEAIALVAFALSWLVKGRADWTFGAVTGRVWHYGLHPKQLFRAARSSKHA